MNKQEIYALISARNIWHEVTEHKAVFNMAEVAEIHLPYPEADAKNLFIRDDKKRNYYLITVKGNKRVDPKAFRQQNDTRGVAAEGLPGKCIYDLEFHVLILLPDRQAFCDAAALPAS